MDPISTAEVVELAITSSPRTAMSNGAVDGAADKDQQESPTVTEPRPRIADFGVSSYERRPVTPWRFLSAVRTQSMLEQFGCGRDSDEREMEGGQKISQTEKRWQGTGFKPLRRHLERLHTQQDRAVAARYTNRRSLLLRWGWFEGCLVVVGATGAAMMSYCAQSRTTDAWTLGSTVSASTLNPVSPQAAASVVFSLTDFAFLQTLIPKAVLDSPATLVTSIAATTLAMTVYHYRHRSEKYQDPLIFAIAGAGALVGRLAGLDGTDVLLRVVPWCVLVSLLVSAASSPRLAGKENTFVDDVTVRVDSKAGGLDLTT